MYSNLTELQVEIDCDPKCKQEKTVLIGSQSVNMCKFIFYLASKNRGEYLCVPLQNFDQDLSKISPRTQQSRCQKLPKILVAILLRSCQDFKILLQRFQNLGSQKVYSRVHTCIFKVLQESSLSTWIT